MMNELLPWLLSIGKYMLASAALLLFYRSFFRKNSTYLESRMFLLSVAIVAVLVSQFRIQVTHPAPTVVEVVQETQPMLNAGGFALPVNPSVGSAGTIKASGSTSTETEISNSMSLLERLQSKPEIIALTVYILVVCCLLFNLLLQYRSIRKLRKKGIISMHDGYKLVEHPEVSTPFSFAKTIFLPSNLNESQREVVLNHELWHIRHKHYVDVLLQELLSCLFWFNPVQGLLRKDLRSVHEFQADRSVLNDGCELYRYQTIILEEVMGNHFRLANGFNQSFTKKRFIQMKNLEPIRLSTVRKLLFVPFLTLLFCALSFVPGKSQVVTVKRSNSTTTFHNGKKTTVSSETIDTLPYAQFVKQNGITADMSGSQLQQSFNHSLDTLERIVGRTLPIVRRLAASAQPSKDVRNMDALMEALEMKANKQGVSYSDFSEETKNSFTQKDFKEFESILRNIKDSVQLLRTKKVDRMDSPDLLKPVGLAQEMMSSSFMKKVMPELFRALNNQMAGAMQGMTGAFQGSSPTLSVSDRSRLDADAKEAGKMMGDAFGQLGSMMGEMTKTMGQAIGNMGIPKEAVSNEAASETLVEESVANRARTQNTDNQRLSRSQQTALAHVAYNEENPLLRKQVVERLTDQVVLAHVAYNDDDQSVRMAAVNRISDQSTLANIVYNEQEASIREVALRKVSNENVLANVAYNEDNEFLRALAVGGISNQNMLANVAYNDKSPKIRKLAVSRLTNQSMLANVAYSDKDEVIQIAAINRITEATILSNIINSTHSERVKQVALNRLLKLTDKTN